MKKMVSGIMAVCMFAMSFCTLPVMGAEDNFYDNLVLRYDFENDAEAPLTIRDVSGNGNDAKVLNSSTELTVKNGSVFFPYHLNDGPAASLRLPNNINKGINDFTYSAWIKMVDCLDWVRIFDFGNAINSGVMYTDSYNSLFLRYTPSTGQIKFQDRWIGSSIDDEKSLVQTYVDDSIFNNKWCMVTLTYEENNGYYTPTLYLNGKKVESFKSSSAKFTRSLKDLGDVTDSTNALFIGSSVWVHYNIMYMENPDFSGYMDDIRLYNKALGADDIASLYLETLHSNMVDENVYIHLMRHGEEIDTITVTPEKNQRNDIYYDVQDLCKRLRIYYSDRHKGHDRGKCNCNCNGKRFGAAH